MYSLIETRQIFVKLAHSSIMRLNESSMQKLFDLMIMGFKMQTLQSCYPEEIIHVTLKHLDTVLNMIESGSEAAELVQSCKMKFIYLVN